METIKFDPEIPFNSLPPLPPQDFTVTENILKQLVSSHRVLAELKGFAEMLPNKNIILNSITLQEAKDSSEIEIQVFLPFVPICCIYLFQQMYHVLPDILCWL